MSRKVTHLVTMDPDGDGWIAECTCGWFQWCELESQACNEVSAHLDAAKVRTP